MQDKIKKEIINELLPNEYSTEQSVIKNYCIDWRGDFEGTSDIILFPSSVAKISRIVKICNKKKNSNSATGRKYKSSRRFRAQKK